MRRFVYSFQEGVGRDRAILGGKGFGLAEMTGLGLPVPPGFTITTAACRAYLESGKLPAGLKDEVSTNLQALEEATGRRFGDPVNPLLVSVRSGAPVSMPGMMDTVLNLGLNDETVKGLAHQTGNEAFALNSYRRLLSMFGDTVAGIHRSHFEEHLERVKAAAGLKNDTELDAEAWREVIAAYEAVMDAEGQRVPQDPHDQLWEAISAVFRSWNSDRAVKYRAEIGIPEDLGTAVNVQAMVFGNRGDHSGTVVDVLEGLLPDGAEGPLEPGDVVGEGPGREDVFDVLLPAVQNGLPRRACRGPRDGGVVVVPRGDFGEGPGWAFALPEVFHRGTIPGFAGGLIKVASGRRPRRRKNRSWCLCA
ncbi:MAG: PEP/pyruvate-binding domain-containing protein [Thermoplasmata archaeon]